MRNQIHYTLVLFVLAAICVGGINGIYYSGAKEKITILEAEAKLKGVRLAFNLPKDCASITEDDGTSVTFKIKDKDGKVVGEKPVTVYRYRGGYAVESKSMGFEGDVVIIVAVAENLSMLIGVCVIKQAETPGFGAEVATEPATWTWFGGKDLGAPKDGIPIYQSTYRGLGEEDLLQPSVLDNDARDKKIDSISGATITSQALYNAVKIGLALLKELAKQGAFDN